jgi:hypothetical protein
MPDSGFERTGCEELLGALCRMSIQCARNSQQNADLCSEAVVPRRQTQGWNRAHFGARRCWAVREVREVGSKNQRVLEPQPQLSRLTSRRLGIRTVPL